MDVIVSKPLHPIQPVDFGAEPRSYRAVRVAHIIGQLHLLAPVEYRLRILDDLRIEAVGNRITEALDMKASRFIGSIDLGKDRVEVEVVEMLGTAIDLPQQFGATDDFVERAEAEASQYFAYFFGDEGHQVDHLFGCAGEFGAQALILDAHTDRTSV